jgi:hypothetical protein
LPNRDKKHTLHGMASLKRVRKTILIRPQTFSEAKRIARKKSLKVYGVIEMALDLYFAALDTQEHNAAGNTNLVTTGKA